MSIDNPKMLDLRENSKRAKPANNSGQLEKIYPQTNESKKEIQNISQPRKKSDSGISRVVIIIIALAAVGFIFYIFGTNKSAPKAADEPKSVVTKWYAVRLVNGEVYYGQVGDILQDPVRIEKVYYDYDQAKAGTADQATDQTASTRLVKRGKETHGPTGEMLVVRSQIIYLEPLKDDSKVLKAILENEK